MNRRLILVLAVLLIAALMYVLAVRRFSAPVSSALPEMLSYVPPDASTILYVDLEVLRQSAMLKRLLQAYGPPPVPKDEDDAGYARFVRETNFDYSRDLDRALLVQFSSGAQTPSLAIADGRFSREKITGYALRTGKVEKQSGADVYAVNSSKPPRTIRFTFLSPARIALVNSPALSLPVAAPQSIPAVTADRPFRERLARFSGTPFFVIGRAESVPRLPKSSGALASILESLLKDVRWLSLSARPESERLRLAIEGECESSLQAEELALYLEGGRMLLGGALNDPKARQSVSPAEFTLLDQLIRNGIIERSANRVQIRFELTEEMLRPILSAAPHTPSR